MTCIVGVKTADGVFLGGDSALADEHWIDTMTAPKVFAVHVKDGTPVGFGFAGSLRAAQVLRHCINWSTVPAPKDPFEWVVANLIPRMRAALAKHGVDESDNGCSRIDSNMLVAVRGHLFEIHSAWQVHETTLGYGAVGSGMDYAVGAMFALGDEVAQGRITMALQAAERFTPNVSAPFSMVFVPTEAPVA